jgi:hypothetical protein
VNIRFTPQKRTLYRTERHVCFVPIAESTWTSQNVRY